MDRKKIFIAALAALAFNTGMAAAAVYPLTGTKHDLSSLGTGSYRAKTTAEGPGGTTEVCIFCHTPHSGNTEAPLWNRVGNQVDSYPTYTSDVLAALNYPAAEDPKTGAAHSRTRICLSCHDGTIALGSVVNMPNVIPSIYTEIQMFGASKIQLNAPGYIGLNLRDDHPVAIPLKKTGGDQELVVPAVTSKVTLIDSAGAKINADGNYVECTSCHNPHDNVNGNFLVASNTGSALCRECHTKTGFEQPTSIHYTATDPYSPPDGKGGNLGTQVGGLGGVQCMNCHFPHKAGIIDVSQLPAANPNLIANPKAGYYLLTYQEEMSCFNNSYRWGQQNINACHGVNANNPNRNIEFVENTASSRHRTQDYVGRHEVTEGQSAGWIGGTLANWHVECADCHNPHTAGGINHISPVDPLVQLTPSSPLYGTGGVSMPGTPRSWSGVPAGSGYAYREPLGAINTGNDSVRYEYEICFKCHTDFAWGSGSAPISTSLGLPMTDQAMEFNTAPPNLSYHPVVGANGSIQGTTVNPWTTGSQTMYCSDCHTKENGTRPLGPHGSSNPFILTTAYNDAYTNNKNLLQSSAPGVSDDLCFKCHSELVYQSGLASLGGTGFSGGGINLHTQHRIHSSASATSAFGYRCVNCHTRVPHGYTRKAMIVMQGEGAPYEAGVTGAGKITPPINLAGSGTYLVGFANRNASCTTVAGCHQP